MSASAFERSCLNARCRAGLQARRAAGLTRPALRRMKADLKVGLYDAPPRHAGLTSPALRRTQGRPQGRPLRGTPRRRELSVEADLQVGLLESHEQQGLIVLRLPAAGEELDAGDEAVHDRRRREAARG